MKAIQIIGGGKDARLELAEVAEPRAAVGEVLIEVAATAVNRADLLQRQGLYPPPPGASTILGLECSGKIVAVGEGVADGRVGETVCALLSGGGYAERVAAPVGSLLPVPASLDVVAAGGFPEVFLTCSLNLFQIGGSAAGSWVLVHGGGSGIGTAAIQLLKAAGARSIVTAGSVGKVERCLELGADHALNYRDGAFGPKVLELTGGLGADVVLDSIGASYLAQHLECLAVGGRLVLIGLMGGASAEISLATLLRRRLSLHGSTLRARPAEEKAAIVAAFLARFGEVFEAGELKPVVHAVLPLSEAQRAHDLVQSSEHFGKVVLQVSDAKSRS